MRVDVINTDFVSGCEDFFGNAVDLLVFNPPSVPTPNDEVGGTGISAAWAGGEDGRVVIDRFLLLLPVSAIIYHPSPVPLIDNRGRCLRRSC